MRSLFLAALLAIPAAAGEMRFGNNTGIVVADVNGQPITPSSVGASTVTITGTGTACFSAGGLVIDCNLNQEYLGTGANISTFSNAGALTLASGAAVTASGANGNVVSASSITTTGSLFGNALSVGGTTINGSGAITLTASQAVTVSGVNGNIISASSITTTSGLFGKTVNVTGTSNIASNKAQVATLNTTASGTTFATCFSTLTITTTGGNVFVAIHGDEKNSTINDGCMVWLLQDGAFVNGESSSVGILESQAAVANNTQMLSWSDFISVTPSVATHNYCLGVGVLTGGTCTFGNILAISGWSVVELK